MADTKGKLPANAIVQKAGEKEIAFTWVFLKFLSWILGYR